LRNHFLELQNRREFILVKKNYFDCHDLKKKMNYNDAWNSCCKLGMQLLYFDDDANMEADLKCLEDWNKGMIKCPM